MSSETQETIVKQALHRAIAKKVKEHPKKSVALGGTLALVLGVVAMLEPLCGVLPNSIAQAVCKAATVASKHFLITVDESGNVRQTEIEVEEPSIQTSDVDPGEAIEAQDAPQ